MQTAFLKHLFIGLSICRGAWWVIKKKNKTLFFIYQTQSICGKIIHSLFKKKRNEIFGKQLALLLDASVPVAVELYPGVCLAPSKDKVQIAQTAVFGKEWELPHGSCWS